MTYLYVTVTQDTQSEKFCFIQSFKLLNNVNCANITVRLANKWFVTHCVLCIIILSFRFLAMSNFLLTKVLKKLWV